MELISAEYKPPYDASGNQGNFAECMYVTKCLIHINPSH